MKYQPNRLGTMIDCSRNAVASVESVKKWIDLTSSIGYNTLMLYTEDTYEVSGEPYFGYMRGRYSREELRGLDAYAKNKNMELIPCIQTLAHLNALNRWPEYKEHFDVDDILLAQDERVYLLIDHMFATLADSFASRVVHIGMDEAHLLGRGRYADLHGVEERFGIMARHLRRVCDIGEKYGFRFLMWSDMFFRLASGGDYYKPETIRDEVKKIIPDNVELVYWDYYSTDRAHYDAMLTTHEKLHPGTWFAGGLWSWAGLAPHNGYSIRTTEAALHSCAMHNTKNLLFTLWGDNGGECSRFALLPALFYAAQAAHGITDIEQVKRNFLARFTVTWDDFMLLDLPGTPGGTSEQVCNAEKYLLYNDPFLGLLDDTTGESTARDYAQCVEKLEIAAEKAGEWRYLFETQAALCRVLAQKATLGADTRKAYAEHDMTALRRILHRYEETERLLWKFFEVYRAQWMKENKPFGFEVQEARLGAILMRVGSCHERLLNYFEGKINKIEELEETRLNFFAPDVKTYYVNEWQKIISPGVI